MAQRGSKWALRAEEVKRLGNLPNVGKATAEDLRRMGIDTLLQMKAIDPLTLYHDMPAVLGYLPDPCVLDVLIAVQRFMNGAPATPWWAYTEERKAMLKALTPAMKKQVERKRWHAGSGH